MRPTVFGGQVALAATSERRRDLIGIIDWRVAECRRLGVKMRRNHYVDQVITDRLDVIVVATGGVPNTSVGVPGDLAIDSWDLWRAPRSRRATSWCTTITVATRPSTPSRH